MEKPSFRDYCAGAFWSYQSHLKLFRLIYPILIKHLPLTLFRLIWLSHSPPFSLNNTTSSLVSVVFHTFGAVRLSSNGREREREGERESACVCVINRSTMGAVSAAMADGVLTFLWVFCASTIGAATSLVATTLGLQLQGLAGLFITTVIVFLLVFTFGIVGELLGGASISPTDTAALYAAGVGSDSLFSMALRFPAQAAGAVGGALAIVEVMPIQYKHLLGGPSIKVDVHTGAIAEGVLTFVITFIVLLIVLKGPSNRIFKTWFLAMSIVALIVTGSNYTGPSMNPANAFGWAYVNNWHNTWDQFYVYWICPFAGAILAAWTFRFIFPPPAAVKKQKKA